MRRLTFYAMPFGAGCLLCQYLLPESWRFWAAAAVIAAAMAAGGMAEIAARMAAEKAAKTGMKAKIAAGVPGGEWRMVRIAAAGLGLGMLWFSGYAALYLEPAQARVGREDVVEAEVLDCPERTDYGARCTVRVPGLRGRAMLYGDEALLSLEPGNRVTAAVRYESAVSLGGEESSYFTARGIFLRLYVRGELEAEAGGAGGLRYLPRRLAGRLRAAVERLYGQPERGLILALLTGERDGLDEQARSDLTRGGLMHLTAVSGLHCGFFISLLGLLVLRRQRLTALLGYPVLLLYMVMVGCTPSVVRSCVMVGFALLAPLVGRESDAPTSLSAALLVILLANPFAVASVSLQLSFAAVAGLLGPGKRLYGALSACRPRALGRTGRGLWALLAGSLSASLGVMALTAPLSAVYFGSLSLVSPLANLLVLWMTPVLFSCALAGTALCALSPVFAPLTWAASALARYVLWAAGLLAGLPGAGVSFTGYPAVMWLVLVYALLGICALSRDRRRKYAVALLASAVGLAAVRALPRLTVRDDLLTAVAVDVGQGAGTLLHAGDDTALVDCGSLGSTRSAAEAVAAAMDLYGWRALDCVALTHYHADHAGALAGLLARVEVGELLLPQLLDSEDQSDLQWEVLELARRYGVPVRYVEEPARIPLGEALLTVYPPVAEGDVNEEGLSLLCTAGDFDLLITGDMNAATERRLVELYALPDIEVLLAGHHGSKYSTSRELLEAAAPEVGIISVGENRFGHPTQEAMERMAAAGMTLYRTDRQGNVLIRVHRRE